MNRKSFCKKLLCVYIFCKCRFDYLHEKITNFQILFLEKCTLSKELLLHIILKEADQPGGPGAWYD